MKSKILNVSFNEDFSKKSYNIHIGTDLILNPKIILRKFIEKKKKLLSFMIAIFHFKIIRINIFINL